MVIVGSRTLQMLLEHPEFPPKQVSIVHLVLWFFASRDCRLDQTLKDFASATNEIKASVVLAIWRSLFHARMLAGSRSPNSVGLVYDLVVTPGSYQFNLPSSCSKGFLKKNCPRRKRQCSRCNSCIRRASFETCCRQFS